MLGLAMGQRPLGAALVPGLRPAGTDRQRPVIIDLFSRNEEGDEILGWFLVLCNVCVCEREHVCGVCVCACVSRCPGRG